PTQLRAKLREPRHLQEWIEAEVTQRRFAERVLGQADPAQASRVGHHELTAVVEAKLDLGEARWPARVNITAVARQLQRRVLGDAKGSGHAEMEDRPRSTVECEPDVLAFARHALDASTRQGANDLLCRPTTKDDLVSSRDDGGDRPAFGHGGRDFSSVFDLGELWH